MRRRPPLRRLGVAAALLVVATPVLASTVLALPLAELTRRADRVVRARVVAQEARWDANRDRLHTYTTLQVLESLKGGGEGLLVVRQLGGELDGTAARIAGDARLRPGDEVVAFLRKNPAGAPVHHVVGLAQGVFRVQPDPIDGPVVVRDLSGLALVGPDGAEVGAGRVAARLTLSELKTAVRGGAR